MLTFKSLKLLKPYIAHIYIYIRGIEFTLEYVACFADSEKYNSVSFNFTKPESPF